MSNGHQDSNVEQAWIRFREKARTETGAAVWASLDQDHNQEQGNVPHAGGAAVRHSAEVESERQSAFKRKRSKLYRVGAGVVAAGLMIGMFTTDWGDKALAAMVQTFRIQHIVSVGVGEQDLTQLRNALMAQGKLEDKHFDLERYGKLVVDGGGRVAQTTSEKAAALIGAPVKTFKADGDAPVAMTATPETRLTFTLNAAPINELIARLGGKYKFPAASDGKAITVQVPATVQTRLVDQAGLNKSLTQLRTPRIDVAEGIDVQQVRKAVLDLPFLPDDMRSKLAGIEDWRQTIIVPGQEGQIRNVRVAGREAVVSSSDNSRMIVWLDGDWIYQLSGSIAAYPSDEAIMAEAQGIAAQ